MVGKDSDAPQDEAERRKHDQAERTESILQTIRKDLGEQSYPVTSEELSANYADRPVDLPNETESLGSVFDRVDRDEFENAEQALEAVATEFNTDRGVGERPETAAGSAEWTDERAAAAQDPETGETGTVEEDSVRETHRRASEAQADDEDDEAR